MRTPARHGHRLSRAAVPANHVHLPKDANRSLAGLLGVALGQELLDVCRRPGIRDNLRQISVALDFRLGLWQA